ncbi:MAG TPA: tetratricopeptide repeat protein [Candidatus Angelobacter sp.]|nr:tetratricopeptide repeat protein [Candidatus Angelobacter sp.]
MPRTRAVAIYILLCCMLPGVSAIAQDIPVPLERFSKPPRPDAAAQAKEDALKRAVAVNPESAEAWTDLGWRLYKDGRYGECEYAMSQARIYAPADPYTLWLSGLAGYAMGNYDAAYKFLWQMWKDNHSYPETVDMGITYDLLGRIALEKRDLFTAAYFFGKAGDEQPKNWQVQFLLGITEWYRQRYGESLAAFERARSLRPGDPLVLDHYAWARAAVDVRYPEDQQFKESKSAIDAALKVDPANGQTYELLGRLEFARGNTSAAVDALKRSISLAPDSTGSRYFLAKVLISIGTPDARIEAKQLLLDAIALAPAYWEGNEESPHAHLLAQMFADEGSYERAQQLLDWIATQDEEAR